jgi:hypothetical protein
MSLTLLLFLFIRGGKAMFNNTIRKKFARENEVMLGDKKVTIPKLTPKKWKELFAVVENLPNLIIKVAMAPREDFAAYVLSAIDLAIDEMVDITAVLTGIDRQYLADNATVPQIIEFFTRTAEYNDLSRAVKNVVSLLPLKRAEE